jgi:hypothetical protein
VEEDDRTQRVTVKLAAALLVGVLTAWVLGRAAGPTSAQGNVTEHFKYGVVGTEARAGVPYWIWRVLPIVFADKLPSRPGVGWEKLGFIYEAPGRDRPIGITLADGFVAVAGLNCATCHAGTIRDAVLASPGCARHASASDGSQAYARFLRARVSDNRPADGERGL